MKTRIKFRKLEARAAADVSTPDFELMIYGDIGDSWYGESVTAKQVVEQISQAKATHILVRINSYGGSVSDGIAIHNALRSCGARITVRIEGVAASIATLIAMAGDEVQAYPNLMFMVHAPWGGVYGNATELREYAELLDKMAASMAASYARKTGQPLADELAILMDGTDHWFNAAEAQDAGYIDTVLDETPAEADADARLTPRSAPMASAMSRYRTAPHAMAAALRPFLMQAMGQPPEAITVPVVPPAAAAASHSLEFCMNLKEIAKALGVSIADGADEAAIRVAIAQHLNLTGTADDAAIAKALAKRPHKDESRAQTIEGIFALVKSALPNRKDLDQLKALALLDEGKDLAVIRAEAMALLKTDQQPVAGSYVPSNVSAGADQRDKTRDSAAQWLMARAGQAPKADLNGNSFRGMSLHDMARECIEMAGVSARGMNRIGIIEAALTHSTSDFPHIFENALHKLVRRGFELQKPSWNRFCKVSSLSDFRPHIRYNIGSIGDLQVRQENGEYKSLTLGDADRETITALSRGGILNVTREMIVNDDMSVFSGAAMMLGQSAARTLDKAVFSLFALNGGNGPTLGDGLPMFHASHANIAAVAAAPTVTSVEAARVQMASQLDPSGNDYLDLRPELFLSSLAVGGLARAVNNSTYDPDAPNKLQRANIVANLFKDIIDTPRLSGNGWFVLADPNLAPVFEVGFLDGVQTPQLAQEESFSQHGMKWRVVYEFGTAGVGYRGITKNAGA